MGRLTTDPNDPELTRGIDREKTGQAKAYLILSQEEISKGYTRPLRDRYIHNKCGSMTTMSIGIAETYARNPKFYGATYCAECGKHLPIEEFKWKDGSTVGT